MTNLRPLLLASALCTAITLPGVAAPRPAAPQPAAPQPAAPQPAAPQPATAATASEAGAAGILEEVVVSSSRIPLPLRQVGTSVTVLTASDIAARGFNSLFEILRTQPAVAASNPGGAGKTTSLRIRGEEGYRTRAYIDGIDISDTSGTQASPRFEEILSSGIERVEILRGPQGLMYGADAGGVIDISTRSDRGDLQGMFSIESGHYGTRQLAVDLGGDAGPLDYTLLASRFRTDGFNASTADSVLRDDDGYANNTLHSRLGWQAARELRLELVGRRTDSDNDYDNCFTVDTFAVSQQCSSDFRQRAWRVTADFRTGDFAHQLAYSSNRNTRSQYTAGMPGFGARGGFEKRAYLGDFTAHPGLRLVYGAEQLTESIDDGSFDQRRDQRGYFLEYQSEPGEALYLTLGARRDHHDDAGRHSSYRASAAYLLALGGGELKLKAAYGTGFRAPSLYEVAYNASAMAFPPASGQTLRVEKSAGYDLGLVWATLHGLQVEVNYFDQRIGDAIYFDLTGFSGYLQDSGDSKSRGVELIAAVPLSGTLQLNGNYTWNETRNPDGSTRSQRPQHLANLGLAWQLMSGDLQLGLYLRAVREATAIDGSALDDYAVLDFNTRYALGRGVAIYGRLQNLLDARYEEVAGYRTAGAALYAGLEYAF